MSSNKTANLQLNQWAAGDAFLRTEFNEDNSKIDAGVGAAKQAAQAAKDAAGAAVNAVKLLDMTTQTAMEKINIDVSGLNLTAYREVKLWVENAVSPTNSMQIRLNDISSRSYYSSGTSNLLDHLASWVPGKADQPANHWGGCVVTFAFLGGIITATSFSVSETYREGYLAQIIQGNHSLTSRVLTPQGLTSIQLMTNNMTLVNAGVHITMVGIKL